MSIIKRAKVVVNPVGYRVLGVYLVLCLYQAVASGGERARIPRPPDGRLEERLPVQLEQVLRDTSPVPDEPSARTSLSNPSLRYTVPEKPYAVLKRGPIEAVVVDNRAVDDAVLPVHRAGYHGLGSLKHSQQPRNLFVPAYAGLNFEHILDGTHQERAILFEPRNVPMELRVIDDHTAELYQAPTPHYGLESCHRYELLEEGIIQMTFECIPRRATWKNGYLHFFWASYIDHPESLDIHFRGRSSADANAPIRWIRGITPQHGKLATHRALNDHRDFPHLKPFPLELPFGFSNYRFAEPLYVGFCRGMAFVPIFRPTDQVRLTQSPSGGGTGCPAWDFQWFIPAPQVGKRYQLIMRALYTEAENQEKDLVTDASPLRASIQRVVDSKWP